MRELLSTVFTDVDASNDPFRCAHFLERMYDRPFIKEYKTAILKMLELKPGLDVLDIGCGLGIDTAEAWKLVEPSGHSIGIDPSAELVKQATERFKRSSCGISFVTAIGESLPFVQSSFDRIRIDRVLQHTKRPGLIINEARRVLRPNGRLVVYDNDWPTFKIASAHNNVAAQLSASWRRSLSCPEIAAQLPNLLESAGFANLETAHFKSTTSSFGLADELYNLNTLLLLLTKCGEVTEPQAQEWRQFIVSTEAKGGFVTELETVLFAVNA